MALRLYADTSVFGGCFDEEFAEASVILMEQIKSGRFTLLISQTTIEELAGAPERVRSVLDELSPDVVEPIDLTPEIISLRNAYIDAGVVGPDSLLDAEHIASATIARADVVVSWNFKHIVQFERIRAYNLVNTQRGYTALAIHSPREVIEL